MSAATSLGLLANCIEDAIVQPVIQFVEQNIRSQDWRFREAAVMAFGSILEGPNTAILNPLAQTVKQKRGVKLKNFRLVSIYSFSIYI